MTGRKRAVLPEGTVNLRVRRGRIALRGGAVMTVREWAALPVGAVSSHVRRRPIALEEALS